MWKICGLDPYLHLIFRSSGRARMDGGYPMRREERQRERERERERRERDGKSKEVTEKDRLKIESIYKGGCVT